MKISGLLFFIAIICLAGCITPGDTGSSGSMEKATEEKPDEEIYSFGFESGDLGDWVVKGDVILEVTNEVANSGDYSMSVSGRSQTWHAPEIFITPMLQENWLYTVSVWVYIPEADGAQPGKIKLTVQTDSGGNANWIEIANPVAVPPGKWKEIKGKYKYAGGVDTVSCYIEGLDPTLEFYVDDITITGHALGS
jgi:endo-1,4-beta-xylanase